MSIDVPFSSAAARIAVMTTDESVMLAAQESLASDFHITLLDAGEGVLALQNDVPLEAVILDLDTPEGSAEPMVELVSQLRKRDEDLVLIGLIQSLTKVWRRKFWRRESRSVSWPRWSSPRCRDSCRARSSSAAARSKGGKSAKRR